MSETGGRDVNEDCVGSIITDAVSGFFVCDGLGGHGMGDVASSLAVNSFREYFSLTEKPDNSVIYSAYQTVHEKITEKQNELNKQSQMKTTAVILLVSDNNALISNIGDSRCYVFFENGEYTRTKDHSVPEILHLSGQIDDSEIRHHPDRNKLLRALGAKEETVKCDIMDAIPLGKCKAFLLCTDGFWENVTEAQMTETLKKSYSAEEWIENMKKIIVKNGIDKSMDNFSAIAVLNDYRY